ncbi:MAG: tetratricopeptide repeat protein [Candidatus Cryptobacteroides sp.]
MAAICCSLVFSWPAEGQQKTSKAEENRIVDAVAAYDSGNYGMASEILKGVLKDNPENDAAHYWLALSGLMMPDMDTAEEHLRAAAALDEDNFWYRYRLAGLYSATGRPELTEDIYEELLKDFPKKSELYYNLAQLYVSQGKMEKALETLNQIETVFGRSEMTAMARFDILRRLDRQREAFETLEEYNSDFSSPQILSILGDYQMSMYNDSTAVAYYDEALDILPDFSPAFIGKAECFRMTRQYDKYFKTLNELALKKDIPAEEKCDYLNAVVQKTDPNFRMTFMPRLDTVMANCIATHPDDSTVAVMNAVYHYATDRKEESKSLFRKNMEKWPDNMSSWASYAEVLIYTSDWKTLSAIGQEAYGRFPDCIDFLEMTVLAEYNLNNTDKVIEICEKIASDPAADSTSVVSAYSTIGDMYHRKLDNRKAYKYYDKALKFNPEYLPVLNNYAYFLCLEGKNLKKAYQMSKITITKEPDNPTYLDTFGWILYCQGKAAEAKPYFKHAMLYGGKESAAVLDHYAEVLYAIGEYDLAFVYWKQAQQKNDGSIADLDGRIAIRRDTMKSKK